MDRFFGGLLNVDVAGRYEACAVVTDDLGSDSTNRCCVAFEAIPSQAFQVQLTWAQDFGDMMTRRLFVFGRLAGEWQDEIDSDFWEVGIVHFTADDPNRPCVENLTDGDPNDQCPGL